MDHTDKLMCGVVGTAVSAAGTGLSFAVVETTYISIGGATPIGSQRVPAYLLECVAN